MHASTIHHATREVPPPELEACVEFYALLGFRRVQEPAGITGRAVWLQSGRTQIHLMPKPEAAPQSGHVAVIAPGYEETLERLRAGGHEVESRREHWGSPRAYVHDPAGNLVELMAWPPDATEVVPGRGSGE